jgi:hypothetical protein
MESKPRYRVLITVLATIVDPDKNETYKKWASQDGGIEETRTVNAKSMQHNYFVKL